MTIKEILKDYNITSCTKFHNYKYLYNSVLKAMKEFGQQCFDAGKNGSLISFETSIKFETFEDYLKSLENE